MEIDFRTARESLIYEIGIQTGILQREQQKLASKSRFDSPKETTSRLIKKLQNQIEFTIRIIKGL